MDVYLFKTADGALRPADDEDREKTKNIKNGTIVKAKVSMVRNYKYLQKFFVFINTTFDMQDHFTDKEVFRKWLTMKAGHFETVVAPNGNTMFLPKSINFRKIKDDHQFEKIFSGCIDAFLQSDLAEGITEDDIRRVIEFG